MDKENKKLCVCVMLASYNGEKYIQEQINSIFRQKNVNIKLVIRDDGSTDNTLKIIEKYKNNKLIKIIKGQNVGPANNFYKLLENSFEADYYAWSDQDDIWDEDKLIIAIKMIKEFEDKPALYYSASRTVDKKNNLLSIIGADSPSLNYGAALVRSKAQGATFLFNNKLLQIARAYTPEFKKCGILHDAWLHRVCLAVGGEVIHDSKPHMSYRIHESNVIARMPSNSIRKRISSFFSIKTTNYCSKVALQLLKGYSLSMSKANYEITFNLANYRNNFKCKLKVLLSSKYKIGVIKEDIKFKISVILNKA